MEYLLLLGIGTKATMGTRLLSSRNTSSFVRCSFGSRRWTPWPTTFSGRSSTTATTTDDVDDGTTANIVLIGAGWWSQVSFLLHLIDR